MEQAKAELMKRNGWRSLVNGVGIGPLGSTISRCTRIPCSGCHQCMKVDAWRFVNYLAVTFEKATVNFMNALEYSGSINADQHGQHFLNSATQLFVARAIACHSYLTVK